MPAKEIFFSGLSGRPFKSPMPGLQGTASFQPDSLWFGLERGLADFRFIGHFLLSEVSDPPSTLEFAVGSGYPALGEKDLGEFAYWLPNLTLEEQRRIAEVLDTVDGTIQQNEAELAKLQELRAGLAADLLSGRVRKVVA